MVTMSPESFESSRTDRSSPVRASSKKQGSTEPTIKAISSPTSSSDSDSAIEQAVSNKTPQRRGSRVLLLALWKEALACSLIVVAVAATIATLLPHQNQPLPEWPFLINIATLLSIYSVTLRAAAAAILIRGFEHLKWSRFRSNRPLYDLVLHDEATRGFIGAMPLLWSGLGWKQWIGALLLLLTLLVEPFTQQVLQYDTCFVPDSTAAAAVPRTMMHISPNDISLAFDAGSVPTYGVQVALGTGVYFVSPVDVVCTTGNCTFPDYESFGYCGACNDASSHLDVAINYNGTALASTSLSDVRYPLPNGFEPMLSVTNIYEESVNGSRGTYNMATANSIGAIVFGLAPTNVGIAKVTIENRCGSPVHTYMYNVTHADPLAYSIASPADSCYLNETWHYFNGAPTYENNNTHAPFHFDVADPNTGEATTDCDIAPGQQSSWRCRGYGAVSCSLYPCVRTYAAQVTNGYFTETVMSETALSSVGEQPETLLQPRWTDDGKEIAASIYLPCLSDDEISFLEQADALNISADGSPWASLWKLTFSRTADLSSDLSWQTDYIYVYELAQDLLTTRSDCLIVYDRSFYIGLVGFVSQGDFTGTLLGDPLYASGAGNAADFGAQYSQYPMSFTGPALLHQLYNNGNFSLERSNEIIRNMSLGLTNYLRMNPGLNSTESSLYQNSSGVVNGTALIQRACLRVRWRWLSLPCVIAVGAIAFGIVAAASAGRHLDREVVSWRSSPLPLVFAGPTGSTDTVVSYDADHITPPVSSWTGPGPHAETAAHTSATDRDIQSMNARARKMLVRLQNDDNGRIALLHVCD